MERTASGRNWCFSKEDNGDVGKLHVKPSAQDSRKLKVWAVHVLKFENVGEEYDEL